MKIEELTTVVTGGTPSTSKSEYWDDGNIPWLQSGCCQNCDVDSTEKFITQAVEIKNKDGESLEFANTNDELYIKFRDEIKDYKYAIIRTVGIKNNDN